MFKSARVILTVMVLLLVAALFPGCGRGVPVLTAEQIADNYAGFFSILHDREDVKEGTFQLYPWSKDVFEIKTKVRPVVRQLDMTDKKWEGDARLRVETESRYSLEVTNISAAMTRDILVKRWVRPDKEEITAVPVKIQIVGFGKRIDARTFQDLNGVGEGLHTYRVRVPDMKFGRGVWLYENDRDYAMAYGRMFRGRYTVDWLKERSIATGDLFTLLVEILEVDGIEVKAE